MKIAVIIPAYNEEARIGDVIDVVKTVRIIDDIIVVDDGSEDSTYDISIGKGITTIPVSYTHLDVYKRQP